jgi:hypothetical protein
MFVPSMAYPKTRQNGDAVRIALHTRVHADRVDQYQAALPAYLNEQPVNAAWQARMAELLEVVHDYSGSGVDAALPVVWDL